MKKFVMVLLACLTAISLTACKEDQAAPKTKPAKTSGKTTEQADSNKEEPAEETKQEAEQGINFLDYRPKVGSKKSFTENGDLVFTEEIIAANDEYVQTLLQLGDNKTTQIYRWTKNEITLIYEESNIEDPHKDILTSFTPIEQFETVVNNDNSKMRSWKLVESDRTEKVPAGEFTHVLKVEKITDEVANEKTTYTRYYAPNLGLIKEEYNLSGTNGYSAKSELEKTE